MPDWFKFFMKQLVSSKKTFVLVSLLTVAVALCSSAAPILIGRIIDGVTLQQGSALLKQTMLLLAVLCLSELFSIVRKYVSSKAMLRLTYRLTQQTLASVLHTSASFFARTARGELLQRCVQDTRIIQQFGLSTIPAFIQQLLVACVAIKVISDIYWPVTVMIVAAYVMVFIPVHIYGKKRGEARRQLNRHNASLRQSLLEKLESVKQIKIFATERYEYEGMRKQQQKWAQLTYVEDMLTSMYKGFPRIPDALAPALVFLFAGWQVVEGRATIGQLMTIIAFIPAINAPVRSFFTLYVTLADIRIRLEGIMDYLRLPIEPGKAGGLAQLPTYCGLPIVFDEVSVEGDRGIQLLNKLSFTIRPGEHVAVVGSSGAGKSTLLKLIARLQEPSAGSIHLGHTPLNQVDASHLRSCIGYVTQEGFLFHDTLLNNVTTYCNAEREAIDTWMKALGADDIVNALPQGYETVIGDKGSMLSGGQRQLVSLVRTMLKQPEMLLLDECTASLDEDSEAIVYETLDKYGSDNGLTRIIVTHRLRCAQYADRILVLDKGKLVQQGTHNELIHSLGRYAELWFAEEERESRAEEQEADDYAGSFL